MHFTQSVCAICVTSLLLAVSFRTAASTVTRSRHLNVDNEGRSIRIVNHSGQRVAVEWVNPDTGDLVPMSNLDVLDGEEIAFKSFVNHTFMVHEPRNGTQCGAAGMQSECTGSIIVVTDQDEQVAVVTENLAVVIAPEEEDSETTDPYDDTDVDCEAKAKKDLQGASSSTEKLKYLNALSECLSKKASLYIHESNDENEFQSNLRLLVSNQMENHTCGNPDSATSEPVRTETWEHLGTAREVGILHDRPSSQIHVIDNFISPQECKAIEAAAKSKLHHGTVADGAGGHRLSDARKAMQAGIRVPWQEEADGNLIVGVMRRMYNYTNQATGYNIAVDGQENLMSIQYFGRGPDAEESPDQYRPHCDGECAGFPHTPGGRVATMVMYCDIPKMGGGTNFQNSGVYVRPKVGAAAFFSYMNTETKHMENGFTSHSGCPVIEGTKRIAVHWMRIGVDAKNPWSTFNTLTIKKD